MADKTNGKLTRRDFNLLTISFFGSSAFLMSGCGGIGGGSGTSALSMVKGIINLPPGLDLSTLQIVGAGEFGTLSASEFSVEVQTGLPSLVTVWDSASKRIVLMGMLDPDASANTLGASSTAAALMFFGMGGMGLNPSDRRALMQRIAESTESTDLTTAFTNAFASDPFAASQGSQALKDAIKTAVTNLSKFPFPGTSKKGRDGGFPPLLTLEPTNEVDGLTFVQSSTPLGFQVQNTRRRYGRVFTYATGHVDQNNVETAETPPLLTGSPLDVPMTVGLLNTSGQGWAQVTSAPMALNILGQDKKTKYEMIALSPVFGGAVPPIYSDSRYSSEVSKWKDECGTLRQSVMLAGIMEIALEILGLGGSAMAYANVQGAIAGLLTTSQVIRTAMTSAYLGNVFYGQVISEFASSMSFEEIFLAEMPLLETLTLKIKGDIAANAVRNAFLRPRLLVARAALVALIALGVIELTDIIAIAKDTMTGLEANKWSGLVFQPSIGLTSTAEKYTPGDQVKFTAQVPATSAPLVYHWKAFGSNLIVLDDGITFDKLEFDSTKNLVTLSTTPSTVGDLTVSCEIFDTSNGGRTSLGVVSKVIKKADKNQVKFSSERLQTNTIVKDNGEMVVNIIQWFHFDVDETGAHEVLLKYANGFVAQLGPEYWSSNNGGIAFSPSMFQIDERESVVLPENVGRYAQGNYFRGGTGKAITIAAGKTARAAEGEDFGAAVAAANHALDLMIPSSVPIDVIWVPV